MNILASDYGQPDPAPWCCWLQSVEEMMMMMMITCARFIYSPNAQKQKSGIGTGKLSF